MGIAVFLEDIEAGDWFLPAPVKGDRHALIPEAIARGAVGYFYEEESFDPLPGVPAECVPDLREKLFFLAMAARPQVEALVAVVAGSNGKTSVKELLGAILLAGHGAESVHISPANFNTKTHLASQILKLGESVEVAAFEVGARKAGDFDLPLQLLKPQVAALLNIGSAHRGEFGGEENQVRTKLSILDAPETKTLVVPSADPRILDHALSRDGRRVITFGTDEAAVYRVILEHGRLMLAAEGMQLEIPRKVIPAWELNAAAAAALARALGVSWDAIGAGLSAVGISPGRFEEREWRGRVVIDDAFNSSPESLRVGLESFLKQYGEKDSVLVLGSMLELGAESAEMHSAVGQRLRGGKFTLFTVGDEARAIGEASGLGAWQHFSSATDAIAALEAGNWNAAYLKASRSVGLLGALK